MMYQRIRKIQSNILVWTRIKTYIKSIMCLYNNINIQSFEYKIKYLKKNWDILIDLIKKL